MSTKFSGNVVFDIKGKPYILNGIIGRGAQGVVYNEQQGELVIKISSTASLAQREELKRRYQWLYENLGNINAPIAGPLALLANPYIGYVMKRVKGHLPFTTLLIPTPDTSLGKWYNQETGGLKRRLILGALLARAFRSLHTSGLAYCDLSDTNILVAKDVKKFSVVLIDSDNLSVPGLAETLVLGTPLYMAPEILCETHQPDSLTDSHSLAVLLFMLLHLNHPLLGDVVQEGPPEFEEQALQGNFPYIYDPADSSNRSRTALPLEAVCTSRLTELFRRAFVEGLKNRTSRPTPGEWEEACWLAADSTTICGNCGASFYPRAISGNKKFCQCPWCSNLILVPALMIFSEVTGEASNLKKIDQNSSVIVLRSSPIAIKARHAFRGFFGGEGDQIVAKILWDQGKKSYEIENTGSGLIYLMRPVDKSLFELREGKSTLIPNGTQIYFDKLSKSSVTRSAKLYDAEKGAE